MRKFEFDVDSARIKCRIDGVVVAVCEEVPPWSPSSWDLVDKFGRRFHDDGDLEFRSRQIIADAYEFASRVHVWW